MPGVDLGDVGHVGVHALADVVRQRHRPGRLADRVAGHLDPLAQLRGAHHPGDPLAQRDHLATGQGGGLEQVVGAVRAGAGHRVAEDHPALGVGVEHLDPLAVEHGDHVTRPVAGARRHVLRHRQVAGHRHGRLERGDRQHRRADGRRAGHVGLHLPHALRRLDRDAAGVEGDALADQRHPLAVGLARRGVGQLDQPRRGLRALPDGDDAAVPAGRAAPARRAPRRRGRRPGRRRRPRRRTAGGRSSFGAVLTQSRLSPHRAGHRGAPGSISARAVASAASGTAISTSATGSRRVGCGVVL